MHGCCLIYLLASIESITVQVSIDILVKRYIVMCRIGCVENTELDSCDANNGCTCKDGFAPPSCCQCDVNGISGRSFYLAPDGNCKCGFLRVHVHDTRLCNKLIPWFVENMNVLAPNCFHHSPLISLYHKHIISTASCTSHLTRCMAVCSS